MSAPPPDVKTGTEIRLDNCAKTFGDGTRALLETDLTVAPGEIVALLGPSGCGKTTMLRIIAGLEAGDPGSRIHFDADDVTRIPIEKRSVGIVFQSYALFPNMSVAGNVGYGLKVQGMRGAAIEARVGEVLALCRLTELAGRSVSALSGGQRQRVALARAVAPRPRVLLLDEPLSALDAALRDQLRSELAALLRQLATTAVFVTHDQAEAMAVADRIAVMNRGRILQIDTPRALYTTPNQAFVAEFVGSANRLDGAVKAKTLSLPGGTLTLPREPEPGEVAYVRGEAISLTPAGKAKLRGTVASVIFQGTHQRIDVSGVTGGLITLDHPGPDVPRIGATVGLKIDPGSIMILPGSGGALP